MKKLYQIGCGILIGTILLSGAYEYRNQKLQKSLSKEILRFHVIANSDEKEDQNLKLLVRDKIGSAMSEYLLDVKNLTECETIVNNHLAQIENCAREVISNAGYHYPVRVELADTEFPVKTYGEYWFPRGTYRALRVIIGEGKGKNWWCVMYPNLCFSNSVYRVDNENSKQKLKEILEPEELEEIVTSGKLRIKLKYFHEWLE